MSATNASPRMLNLTILFLSMMTVATAASTKTGDSTLSNPSDSMVKRDDTTNYCPDQPLARLWWTSVDDNDLGVTFVNLPCEERCYDSCQADGAAWSSYSWCEEYKICWCRPGGIETYNPLRSPVNYPAVNLASTFKSTCATLLQYSDATRQLSCEDIMVTTDNGITLLDGGCIRELADGSNGTGTGAHTSGGSITSGDTSGDSTSVSNTSGSDDDSGSTSSSNIPLARLWWTSVDDNPLGVDFGDLVTEKSCYDSCGASGITWLSYSWCEEYKKCWCRSGGIDTYNPLRSPVNYPAVNIASTFQSTCEVLLQYSQATATLSCQDIMINPSTGITLLDGSSIQELSDGHGKTANNRY